ncbi:hypothetical protein V6N13_008976 [Hibiscus sabdariffa]
MATCDIEPNKTIHRIAKAKGLVGTILSVKVIQAEEESRKLIFSEKEAVWSNFFTRINVGDVFQGKVGSVEDYGAFVHLCFPDDECICLYKALGPNYYALLVLVGCLNGIFIEILFRAKSRITLSIKQLEEDPLLGTLNKVIPQVCDLKP